MLREIERLRRENARLETENDMLRKCVREMRALLHRMRMRRREEGLSARLGRAEWALREVFFSLPAPVRTVLSIMAGAMLGLSLCLLIERVRFWWIA